MQTSFTFSKSAESSLLERIQSFRAARASRLQSRSHDDNPVIMSDHNNEKHSRSTLADAIRKIESRPSASVDAAKLAAVSAQKLRNKALRMLTTREHSKGELTRKLVHAKTRAALRSDTPLDRGAKQQQKDDIESLVETLSAQGWQSDDRYAEAMVRRLSGQASKRMIADKLAQAGIDKALATHALDAIELDDRDVAQALWQRRFGNAPATEKERQRQVRFLLSRGFALSDAFRIVSCIRFNDENAM